MMLTPETDCFFATRPDEASLYAVFSMRLEEFGPYRMRVQKTQITFENNHVFASVSMRGKGSLIITFGLPHRVASERIWQAAEPYPNRWTHHIKVTQTEEIDDELMVWIHAAYLFAQKK